MKEIKYWVWLSMIFGVESRTMWKLMREFESASEAYYQLSSGSADIKLSEKYRKNIKNCSVEQAESLIEQCGKSGINIICYSSPEYPDRLRHIIDPPAVLYYKGDITCICGDRIISCVGTRKASSYTISVVSEICRELAGYGFTIVSGFAVGVDIASHLAAVSVKRPTACVLGCGVDVNYPSGNFQYRDSIIENGGVFISEYPPGTPAYSHNFPKRNRILSAIGRATVVFEAAIKSGSMVTASIADEQNREVFCMPPADITDKRYAGNIKLLRNIARPFYSCEEIFDFFNLKNCRDTDFIKQEISYDKPVVCSFPEKKKKAVPEKTRPEESVPQKTEPVETIINHDIETDNSLTPVQCEIVRLLTNCAVHIDVIAYKLNMDIMELMAELTELELLDIIEALPGKLFKKR